MSRVPQQVRWGGLWRGKRSGAHLLVCAWCTLCLMRQGSKG